MATVNRGPRVGPYPAAQVPRATTANHYSRIPQYGRNAPYYVNQHQFPVYTSLYNGWGWPNSVKPWVPGRPAVVGWVPVVQSPPYLPGRVPVAFNPGFRGLVVGSGGTYSQGNYHNRYNHNYNHNPAVRTRRAAETTVGMGISACPIVPSNTATNYYVPQRRPQQHRNHQRPQQHRSHQRITTKNYPHPATILRPTTLHNPHLPVYNPPPASGTASYLPQNQPTMGMVRSYGMSWKSNTNDTEAATHPQIETSAPVVSPLPVPVREDSDDSCDSILKNTPIFPDSSQETSFPSIPQASCQNTLPSKETNATMSSGASAALERMTETVSRRLDKTIDTEPVSKASEPAPMSAPNKNRSSLPENPRLSGPSCNKVPKNDKNKQREPQSTKPAAREQANNKPQLTQPKQPQNTPAIELESGDVKTRKVDERAGHIRGSTSGGKKYKKGKHNKSGSVTSGKLTRSGSSNFSSQGKQSVSEVTSQGNKNLKNKSTPEESRPLPHRLTSGGSAASTSRRRRNLSGSSSTVLPRQGDFQQENITPASKANPPVTTINHANDVAFLQATSDGWLEVSSTHSQPTIVEKSTHTAPDVPVLRAKYEVPSAYSYQQPERTMFKAENRQFYLPQTPVQLIQKGYSMQNSTAPAYHVGQNQVPYNQKPQYLAMQSQIPQHHQVYHQNLQSHQAIHHQRQQNQQTYQTHQVHQQVQTQGFHHNLNPAKRGPDTKNGYTLPQIHTQQRIQHQQYPSSNFPFHQSQTQQKPPRFQGAPTSHTAPPTPHRGNRYAANAVNQNVYAGAPYHRFATTQASNGNYGGNIVPEFNRGHIRNRSNQSLHDYGRNSKKPAIVQAARYKPRSPSPPPIVKMAVRNKKLLWPIGPFIPFSTKICSPWELDSTTFVNVFCTTVGVLRLPFSVEFLRTLKSVLPPKHGDHIITFPTALADSADMTPYWERCYYCQQFLFKYAKHLGFKPFEKIPMKDWPRVEIMLGTDNTENSKFNIYLSQPDEKRLLFRCVEQKLGDSDKAPKATFFVTVHQTGVNQVQYSDPDLQDDKVTLPPLDGSRDPRTTPEFQYNLPHYLCLNERRGIYGCGFTDIGVPAKRLNFHPFGKTNFDSLWYGMAHLQELVIADDNASIIDAMCFDPDHVFGIPNVVGYCKKRTAVMMGNGEPKFLEHDEVLRLNCKAAAPPPPSSSRRREPVVPNDEFERERESPQTKSSDVNGDTKSTST
ncbi:hypothetical protein TWF594_011264 [Orbilia oligospora]|nr:hypothetical protein TWF594_011264 [Orbilia oligospora]